MERRHGQGEQPNFQEAAIERLEQAVAAIHDSDSFRRWLDISSRFHTYSLGNQLLIALQNPDATYVAGFHAWRKLGRHVRRGETGIRIMVPHARKVINEDGDEERRVFGFGIGVVFDINQTEGEPLPEHVVPTLEGEAGAELWDGLHQYASREDVSVSVVEPASLPSETMGYYDPSRKAIVVGAYGQRQRTKTLAHELSHHVARVDDRASNECIAEGIAYVVCARVGIDTGERSFPYVAGWAQDQEVLRNVLETIQGASATIISGVEQTERTVRPPSTR